MTKIQQEIVINTIIPLLPKNKRGFSSRFDTKLILKCIFHKLKNGTQWHCLFVDLEGVTYPFSYQTVYYYFNKWSKLGIFETAFLKTQLDNISKIAVTNLNLDGTQSLSKKGAKP